MSEKRETEYVVPDLVRIAIADLFNYEIRDIAKTIANKIADECFGEKDEIECLRKKENAVGEIPKLVSEYLKILDEKDRKRVEEIERKVRKTLEKARRRIRERIKDLLRMYTAQYLREWAVEIEMNK